MLLYIDMIWGEKQVEMHKVKWISLLGAITLVITPTVSGMH